LAYVWKYLRNLFIFTTLRKNWDDVAENVFFAPDASRVPEPETYMDELRTSRGKTLQAV